MSAGLQSSISPNCCAGTARLRTRKGTRALGNFKQAVLVPRWFVDGTRLVQLAWDNGISTSTAYRYPHDGLTVPADHVPGLCTALERAAAADAGGVVLAAARAGPSRAGPGRPTTAGRPGP